MSDRFCICVRVEDAFTEQVPTCRLRTAIAHTLERHHAATETGVTLLVTDDDAVHKLNRRYLGIDRPTDVLSFPAGEESVPGMEEAPYLGDIIIAYPYTAAQAAEDGQDLDHALILLAVHGTLHLLGHNHDSTEAQAAMWAEQESILAALDVPLSVIPPHYDFPSEEAN